MPTRQRLLLAALIGISSASLCYFNLVRRDQLGADFSFPWRAAGYLLDGQNPYSAIRPEGAYPFQTYFYYPLTAALAAIPFAWLPAQTAGALFFGLSSALLAYAIARQDWRQLILFLSAPYWVALGVAQWSPLIVAATLLPWAQWLLACKPNLGIAGFLYRPTWSGLIGMILFGLLSLLLLPSWPFDWLQVSRTLEGHPPPLLILPFGPLLAFALIRWRMKESRLLIGLSILPQLLFFYDQLLLWLIPPNWKYSLLLTLSSWLAYLAWRLTGTDIHSGKILIQPDLFVLGLIYLPALGMLFWPKRLPA